MIKIDYFNITSFNASFELEAALLVLQYSPPAFNMIIQDQLFVQCQVGYELLTESKKNGWNEEKLQHITIISPRMLDFFNCTITFSNIIIQTFKSCFKYFIT